MSALGKSYGRGAWLAGVLQPKKVSANKIEKKSIVVVATDKNGRIIRHIKLKRVMGLFLIYLSFLHPLNLASTIPTTQRTLNTWFLILQALPTSTRNKKVPPNKMRLPKQARLHPYEKTTLPRPPQAVLLRISAE